MHNNTLQLHNRNNQLSNCMTYLLIFTSAVSTFANTKPYPTHQFHIISLGVDAVYVKTSKQT